MAERCEISGHAVKETVRQTETGVDTIWDGLHTVIFAGKEYLADRSVVHDAGRRGKGLSFIEHTEKALNLSALNHVLNQMGYQLIIPNTEHKPDTA